MITDSARERLSAAAQDSRPEGVQESTKTKRCNDHKHDKLHDHRSQGEHEKIILEGDKG